MALAAHLAAHANSISRAMFVATADQNYILARRAFFDAIDSDFFWLSLHALEKYCKAVLLINGQSAKGFGHDIVKLHHAVSKMEPRLPLGTLVDPQVQGLYWSNVPFEKYLARVNEYGSADNRYLLYGYTVLPDELFKVDQLVWAIRRCCTPFKITIRDNGKILKEVDEVDGLVRRMDKWRLGGFTPIEKLMDQPSDDDRRTAFLRLNVPFAPNAQHTVEGWRSSGTDSPLLNTIELLRNPNATVETRRECAEVLQWVIDHIQLTKEDRKQLQDLIASNKP